MEEYGTASLATDDNLIRRMRFACWITEAKIHKHNRNIWFLLLLTAGRNIF